MPNEKRAGTRTAKPKPKPGPARKSKPDPRPPAGAPGPRRALSNQGGPTARRGDAKAGQALVEALACSGAPDERLTHGFHSYPARMHPGIARSLVANFSQPGQRVLDPFCGSGTVLIEALCQGRRGLGVDLNPLSLRIAEVCCTLRDAQWRGGFAEALDAITEASLLRVRERRKARAPLSPRERAFYAPHVLLEMAGLRDEIAEYPAQDQAQRRALEVVLSSLVVKLSKQRADTAEEQVDKRLRKGLASEFFQRKGQELGARWQALEHACQGQSTHTVTLKEGDARRLSTMLRGKRADVILSSPPYGGTYDYHSHHARRYPWLGLSAGRFARFEVGARRHLSASDVPAKDAHARWDAELLECLTSMADALEPSGQIVLLMGDAQLGPKRIDAAEQLAALCPRAGLQFVATASQARKDWSRGPARREHLVLLQHATPTQSRRRS